MNVEKYYAKIAKEYGLAKNSTMLDEHIRDLEIEALISCLKTMRSLFSSFVIGADKAWRQVFRVLEVGCGNGYAADIITHNTDISLVCIDICDAFIKLAKSRKLPAVHFEKGDVRSLEFSDGEFDVVYSERCLINLLTREEQFKALAEIHRVLKPNGCYIMLEAFEDGLQNLNAARDSVGLEALPIHADINLYFDKDVLWQDFQHGPFVSESRVAFPFNFLSSYFFFSRVIYPSLIQGKKEVKRNNVFDVFAFDFARVAAPVVGNFSPIQLFIWRKAEEC